MPYSNLMTTPHVTIEVQTSRGYATLAIHTGRLVVTSPARWADRLATFQQVGLCVAALAAGASLPEARFGEVNGRPAKGTAMGQRHRIVALAKRLQSAVEAGMMTIEWVWAPTLIQRTTAFDAVLVAPLGDSDAA